MNDVGSKSPLACGLPWGVYLACSWTWCIGMFLPVLLMRDFGWAGFAVFALPNCVGAAAMGWVLSRREASREFVEAHGTAIRLFSLVTFLFHVMWLMEVAVPLASVARARELALVCVFLTFGFVFSTGTRAAALVYMVSLGAIAYWVTHAARVPTTAAEIAAWDGARLPAVHLLGLTPVCVFGFLLCPYLDGTFHKARQAVDAHGARWAFGLGFLLFFAAMIVFTAMYRGLFGHSYSGMDGTKGVGPERWVVGLVAVHMVVQATFTMGQHLRVLMEQAPGAKRASGWAIAAIGTLFVAVLRMVMTQTPGKTPPPVWDVAGDGLSWYRIFMGAYGLLFPAYVWICGRGIGHQASGIRKPSVEQVKVWLMACLIASPLMYKGFVERKTLLLIPAMALVIAARWMVRETEGTGHRALGTGERQKT